MKERTSIKKIAEIGMGKPAAYDLTISGIHELISLINEQELQYGYINCVFKIIGIAFNYGFVKGARCERNRPNTLRLY